MQRVSELDHRCEDQRLPAMAGAWAVGCSASGRVDRALHLETGTLIRLPRSFESVGLAPGVVYAVGDAGGVFDLGLDGAVERAGVPVVRSEAISPPVTDGQHGVLLSAEHVQAFDLGDRHRFLEQARPIGWAAPALRWPMVMWVQLGADGTEDLWALDADQRTARPQAVRAGPGHQRHPLLTETLMGWVDQGELMVEYRDGRVVHLASDVGFHAPPVAWEDVLCWEDRTGHDLDIRCSDGLMAAGPGDQRWPSRSAGWLLYREDGKTWAKPAPSARERATMPP